MAAGLQKFGIADSIPSDNIYMQAQIESYIVIWIG